MVSKPLSSESHRSNPTFRFNSHVPFASPNQFTTICRPHLLLPMPPIHQLLLAAILGSLSPEIHSLVAAASTAAEAWSILNRTYASTSRSKVFQLKKDLSKLQLGSSSAAEFLQQVKSKVDELAVIDHRLSDDDVTFYVLDGLGPNYRELASFIQARDTPITFSELHDKVIA